MAKNVQLTVDIKGGDSVGKAAEKTKSLKQELRELKQELASGNLTGKAFDEAAKKAGQLQDAIGDVNQRVKNLASDTGKLDGFIDIATGITGGFAAAQGAMALFGSENEDVQKQLVKIQGAVALLNGVQQVANTLNKDSAAMTQLQSIRLKVLTAVQARYTAVVGTTTGAMKLLRLAGATLGIGLIVTAIGLLIANFDKIKKSVLNFIPALANVGELFTKVKNAVMDFVGISSEAERQEEKAAKQRAVRSQQLKDEIELMEANGASARDLYLAKRKLLFNDLETLKIAAFKKDATQEEIKAYNAMVQAIRVLDAEETKRIKDGADKENEEAAKKRKEAHDKRVEQEKKNAEELKKILDDATKVKQQKDFTDKAKEIDDLGRTYKEKIKLAKGNAEAEKQIIEASLIELKAINDKYAKEEQEKQKEINEKTTELQSQRALLTMSERGKEIFDIQEKYRLQIESAKGNAEQIKIIEENLLTELSAIRKKFADEDAASEIERRQNLENAKLGIANQSAQFLQQISGKQKGIALAALAIEKGAAIADVIIQGQRANAKLTALYPAPANVPFIAANNIRTALSVATIAATGIQGAKNITGGGTGGGGSVQPPNIRGSQTTNEPTSQPATKVFVTETDIRSKIRKVDGIYSQATIQ